MMERRCFLKLSGELAVSVIVMPSTLMLSGCAPPSQEQITKLINVALSSITAILRVAEPGAAWVDDLKAAADALRTAMSEWATNGGVQQKIINILNTIVAITAVIPVTAPYSALIAIIVAGVEAVLAVMPASGMPANQQAARSPFAKGNRLHVTLKKRFYEKFPTAEDYTKQWNEAVKQNATLAPAAL